MQRVQTLLVSENNHPAVLISQHSLSRHTMVNHTNCIETVKRSNSFRDMKGFAFSGKNMQLHIYVYRKQQGTNNNNIIISELTKYIPQILFKNYVIRRSLNTQDSLIEV